MATIKDWRNIVKIYSIPQTDCSVSKSLKRLKLESIMDITYTGKTIRNQGTKNKEKLTILHQKIDQSM